MTTLSRLRLHILEKYRLVLASEPSPDSFRDYVTALSARLIREGIDATALPLFGDHINPDLSYIAPDCFLATLGYRTFGELVTTNTGRLYRFDTPHTLRWLFESCRLWYDEPDLHAPLMRCDVQSDDPRMDKEVGAVVHVGTAWVHPSLRGNGLGKAMVALHRLEAMERFGDALMFGTTVASKTGGFTGTTAYDGTATVSMFAPGDANGVSEVQQIRIWSPEAILAAAERVLSSDNVS